ncbi:anaerobic sulfatase maturase [Photobacterium sp. SDRW27]|uniref:anaerobic sulfatase maturase n=1 Tax=Photobacterium obscurum TaxID=2829490 RepID=UPI002244DEED|nr:anaerobic sulfatase maturase [Photobacterium obscurum]MCW8332177.1 anaerobic sulfatase maturase [Photobacterium obscurum]
MQVSSNYHIMAKPTGSICNIGCDYCFYLEKHKLYPEREHNWRMDDETLEQYIKQTIHAQDNDYVQFTWQGGEPMMMGLPFYEKAVRLSKHYSNGKQIEHTFQTNGLLIDDAWCQFFKENNFLIGISIDGPEELHDHFRKTRAGKPTHSKVVQGINLLRKHGVEFNTLTVVSSENVKHPLRVYEFLKEIGSSYIQFIPLVERESHTEKNNPLRLVLPHEPAAEVTSWSVPPKAYGQFLSEIFDVWVRRDVGRVFINMFDSTLSAWCDCSSSICHLSETCGNAFVLESNGDLYSCDHYVYPEYLIGNINQKTINECKVTPQAIEFRTKKQLELTPECESCEYKFACNGGCPKHRFSVSGEGYPRHNYFCQGYKAFFEHSAKYMQTMRTLINSGRYADEIMLMLAYQESSKLTTTGSTGRNESCPCESGKKYKHCCGKQ